MSDRPGRGTLEQLRENLQAVTTRFARTLACLLLAAGVAVAGTGFLTAALYLVLARRFAPTGAAALVGGLLLALAVVLLYLAKRNTGPARRPETGSAPVTDETGRRQYRGNADHYPPAELAASLGAAIGDQGARWTRAHPFSAVAAALVAGVAVGVSPRLRGELEQLMGALSAKDESGKK